MHIPAGTIHAYKNISATAKMIGVVSDPRGGEFFAALDQLKVPQDLPRILAIAESFGVTFLVPKAPETR